MITHIVWDWNGTLLNDVQACVDAINVLLERRRLPAVSRRRYLDVFDFPVRNYYLALGFDFARDDWRAVAHEYHEVYARTSTGAPLRDGTGACLEALQSRGIRHSVLSACETGLLRRMIAERGILDSFDHVYGLSDLYAHSKLDLGHALLRETDLDPARTLLVGDTTHDHAVASALGLPCLLMTGGHQADHKLVPCGCPLVPGYDGILAHLGPPPGEAE
jgi:phosphoglycolate phosphatase